MNIYQETWTICNYNAYMYIYIYYICFSQIQGCSKALLHWYFYFKVSEITIYKNTKTNGAFNTWIRIIAVILFNVTSFSSNDTDQTRSETPANFADKMFSHRGPWTINGRLQLFYIAVANFTGLALNMRPDVVVEGVQVRWL